MVCIWRSLIHIGAPHAMTDIHPSPLLTVTEAASYLKISRSSMYRLLDERHIPTVQLLERRRFIEKRVLDELITNPHTDFTQYRTNTND